MAHEHVLDRQLEPCADARDVLLLLLAHILVALRDPPHAKRAVDRDDEIADRESRHSPRAT
jgi:hypothetical protein